MKTEAPSERSLNTPAGKQQGLLKQLFARIDCLEQINRAQAKQLQMLERHIRAQAKQLQVAAEQKQGLQETIQGLRDELARLKKLPK